MRNLMTFAIVLGCSLLPLLAFAADGEGITGIGSVAAQVTGNFGALARLITAASYLSGAGLSVAGIFKLKAHKDNPTQVQLSQGLVLILLGAILIFLPTLINVAGQTLFSTSAKSGGVGGTSVLGGGFTS